MLLADVIGALFPLELIALDLGVPVYIYNELSNHHSSQQG